MWFERLLRRIERSRFGDALEKRIRLLEYGDSPGRIYVENVRVFLGVSHRIATALCDLAVREGFFEHCTAIMCPHDERILLELCNDAADEVPATITCEVCEALEIEPSEFSRDECRAMPFYRVRGYVAEANA